MNGSGFVIDLHRCVGCSACVLACRIENRRLDVSPWRRVLALNLRRHEGGPTCFLSVACHHCEDPACLRGCPSGAYEKRPDGIVIHREERCLGCRYCEMTCPFGAPRFDEGLGIVSKCHLCAHRIDDGALPACVAACPTGALRFSSGGAAHGPAVPDVPGFVDPAGCRPNIRFLPPVHARRAALYRHLQEVLSP
ncbi:MAG: 4Fe-4S dicluster domain-containing protein [Acidobacteriota bacterium]